MSFKKLLLTAILAGSFIAPTFAQDNDSKSEGEVKPAYYVAEFEPTNMETMKPYSEKVESTFTPYSGRYVVRGGSPDVKEGFGAQGRLVIIKFDSLEQAEAWHNSPEYQAIIPIRQRSGNTRSYIVQGLR